MNVLSLLYQLLQGPSLIDGNDWPVIIEMSHRVFFARKFDFGPDGKENLFTKEYQFIISFLHFDNLLCYDELCKLFVVLCMTIY